MTVQQRRRELRNYGIALGCSLAGVAFGYLVHRGGWGGAFGMLFAILSAGCGIVCAGALLRVPKAGKPL